MMVAVVKLTEEKDPRYARAAELAHHWEQAGDAERAITWHRRAAEVAGLASATQSIRHWRKVREISSRLPPSPETDEAGTTARVQLLMNGSVVGAPSAEMAALFDEGLEMARRGRNEPAHARLLAAYGVYRLVTEGRLTKLSPTSRRPCARSTGPMTSPSRSRRDSTSLSRSSSGIPVRACG
jgi:hypothetical protein